MNHAIIRHAQPGSLICLSALTVMFSAATLGQPTTSESETSAPAGSVQAEKWIAPIPVESIGLHYPAAEDRANVEGWVLVEMMLDRKGKPFEVAVVASSGNPNFEKEAVRAAESVNFSPGTLNGQPTESVFRLKIQFAKGASGPAARPDFIAHYLSLQRAVAAGNKDAADDAMQGLNVGNLYEDAYFGLASYQYARRWGDETQQLAGLRRAIAYESRAKYLAETEFRSALIQCLALEVRLHRYLEAQDTWASLQSSGADPAIQSKIRPMMQQIDKIRVSGIAYDVPGSMPNGTWTLGLYKSKFRIKVDQGHISDIRLRCAKGFERFAFDPVREFQLDTKYGNCSMELEGEPGTQFTLTQF